MIRECVENDFEVIYEIINDSAEAYRGVIPEDRWNEPYMSFAYLKSEIEADVVFLGYTEGGGRLPEREVDRGWFPGWSDHAGNARAGESSGRESAGSPGVERPCMSPCSYLTPMYDGFKMIRQKVTN